MFAKSAPCIVSCFAATAEKRQADEPLSSVAEEPRKKKIDGDVPSGVVAEILEVTSDPKKMLGPDVGTRTQVHWFSDHFPGAPRLTGFTPDPNVDSC